MSIKSFFQKKFFLGITSVLLMSAGCSSNSFDAPDSRYLLDFHNKILTESNFVKPMLKEDDLALFVDYSNCIAVGQHSDFFNSLRSSFVAATRHYYSIKGSVITEEKEVLKDVYKELCNIQEVHYADLKSAANMIVNRDAEGVLMTDGEYYERNIAKGHVSDPYLADSFKTWLRKGHDIYIIAEPFTETKDSLLFNKKRFYFLFTDSRLEGNIYQRIRKTANLDFPGITQLHLSASRPEVILTGKEHLTINPDLMSEQYKKEGNVEILDWTAAIWSNIETLVIAARDDQTGNILEKGKVAISGLNVDKTSYGCFKITDITFDVYNIGYEYADYYNQKEMQIPDDSINVVLPKPVTNAFVYDKDTFAKEGRIDIYFDAQMWNPTSVLTGNDFNYTMIDINVAAVENQTNDYDFLFEFDDINDPGKKNISVSQSVKQALFDPEIQKMMNSAKLYTILIRSNAY